MTYFLERKIPGIIFNQYVKNNILIENGKKVSHKKFLDYRELYLKTDKSLAIA